jgi:succinate-acetate transporter protein
MFHNFAMNLSDYLGLAVVLGFGLWWLVFPQSVVGFYTSFHTGKVKMPPARAIRLAGAFWIVLVLAVVFLTFRKH